MHEDAAARIMMGADAELFEGVRDVVGAVGRRFDAGEITIERTYDPEEGLVSLVIHLRVDRPDAGVIPLEMKLAREYDTARVRALGSALTPMVTGRE